MKPIIIIGKGPSSRKVAKSDKYDVATVNNTIWLCDSPTYAFFNDVELFCLCKKEDFKNVSTIVCPSFLHSHWAKLEGICTQDETHFYELANLFPGWLDHIEFMPYELHPGDNDRPEEQQRISQGSPPAPCLDKWPGSTGGTAAGWLSKFAGYRDFILMGCDPEGGYNPIFKGAGHKDGVKGFNGQGTDEQPSHLYQENYNIITNFITSYGGRARHINEVSIEEQTNLGLL